MRRMIGIAAAVVLASGAAANAGYTLVTQASGSASERNHAQIMARFYGDGSFNNTDFVASGLDFVGTGSFSTISFVRVEDFGDAGIASVRNPLLIGSSNITGVTDQVWRDGQVHVQSHAKFAGYNQRASYLLGASGGSPSLIGNVTSVQGDGVVTAFASTTFTAGAAMDFRLMRSGDGNDYASLAWSSSVSDNTGNDYRDELDHMVTYLIQGLSTPTYMVFFDDQSHPGTDRDFNDFSMTLSVVPLPPAAWAGLGSLACVAGFGVIRRRRLAAN